MKLKTAVIFLLVFGVLLYFNSLFGAFVWDDEEQIVANNLIHSILNIPYFFLGSTFNSGGGGAMTGIYYKPLMSTFFSLIYTIFGPNPFFFHAFQLSLHITNALLVFYFLKYFFNIRAAFLAALIFLIHPINTEAVVYISALQDILFFFFGMSALLIVKKNSNSSLAIILSGLLLFLSLLSKETGAAFFAMAIGMKLFFEKQKRSLYLLSFTTAGALYLFLRFMVAGVLLGRSGPSPIMMASLSERIISMPSIFFFYIKTFFWPQDLSIARHFLVQTIDFNNFFQPLIYIFFFLFLILASSLLVYKNDRHNLKTFVFFGFWFAVGMVIHLQIFPLDMTVAERWFYFPMIGLLGIIIKTVESVRLTEKKQLIFIVVLCLLIGALSIRTFIRNMDWKDGLTLFYHDITISENSFDLENNLGVELFRAGRIDEASTHFYKSTQIAPHWWTNWNNLGVVSERKGDFDHALIYYKKSIDNGQYYLAYENYALLLLNGKKDPKAASEFTQQSLKIFPGNKKLQNILAVSEYKLKN